MGRRYGPYLVGLNIGTSSVGWAVTDRNYEVLKFNGRSMWGIRLFDEAFTAQQARLHRAERRTNDRKKWRLGLLQELFADAVGSVDDRFFLRLRESGFWADDKHESGYQPNSLFDDDGYDDRVHHSRYRSVYHLRKALIEGDEEALSDPRKVYLACHHILKNRGHFLFAGELNALTGNLDQAMDELSVLMREELGVDFICRDIETFSAIIKDRSMTITEKKRRLRDMFEISSDRGMRERQRDFADMLAGGTVRGCRLLGLPPVEGDVKLSFRSEDFDEGLSSYRSVCGEGLYVLEKMKAVYDWGILQRILEGSEYISIAKVAVYEKHREDLASLKRYIREKVPGEYGTVFTDPETPDGYCAYVGTTMRKGRRIKVRACTYEAFIKRIRRTVMKGADCEERRALIEKIDGGDFMPRQVSRDNGVIPYQINRNELAKILENAAVYHPFLREEDEYGTTADKIMSLLTFRIPYYVGPLNTSNSHRGFAWAEKRTEEKVRPWNFSSVVDEEKSAENFMRRMTGKCEYLPWADVLPRSSIIYQAYMVLNELNLLRVDDRPLPVRVKQDLFQNLFRNNKFVTVRQISGYLRSAGYIDAGSRITGLDGPFRSSVSSYFLLSSLFGGEERIGGTEMERIIFCSTVFGNEKKMLEKRLRSEMGDILTDREIMRIKGMTFSGWGNYSREFLLETKAADPVTGREESILEALYNGQDDLNDLLRKDGRFSDVIEKKNREMTGPAGDIGYDEVDSLYASPAVKRAIWQTMLILREIEKVTGRPPERIFMKMDGRREGSPQGPGRKKELTEIYERSAREIRAWKAQEASAVLSSSTEEDLRRNRLYLWCCQMGRCMYSGEKIDIEDIYSGEDVCDIDHIYPRSRVDDDSVEDNKVLVLKKMNSAKGDTYPLPEKWRMQRTSFWRMLRDKGLITGEKFRRLVREEGLTVHEMTAFAAGLFTDMKYGTRTAGGLFERALGCPVSYVRGETIDLFREGADDSLYGYGGADREFRDMRRMENRLTRCRSINDFHLAEDAYLSIVTGKVFLARYTDDPQAFIQKLIEEGRFEAHSIRTVFRFPSEAWTPSAEQEGTMATVKRRMKRHDIRFTRYSYEKKHGQNGGLYDQNPVKAQPGLQPIKGGDERYRDTARYGGYRTITPAYFMLVEYTDRKDRKVRRMETVPLFMKDRFEKDTSFREEILEEFAERAGFTSPRIIIGRIKFGALIDMNGFRMHLTGNNEKQMIFRNANQLILDDVYVKYIKRLEKFARRRERDREALLTPYDRVSPVMSLELYDVFISKIEDTVYRERLKTQGKTLRKGRDRFISLSREDQALVLMEILNMFRCIARGADLRKIGQSAGAGENITVSKNVKPSYNMKLINQSVTGLFENRQEM